MPDNKTTGRRGLPSDEAQIAELREAINRAYRVLCAGHSPWSARETNARRILRQAGAQPLTRVGANNNAR